MFNESSINRNSRQPATIVLLAGETKPLRVGGDFFYVETVSGGSALVSVNGGEFASCPQGLVHSGVAGRDDIQQLRFRNSGGTTITLSVIFGKGAMQILGNVIATISGAVTITEPAAADVTADCAVITGAATYSDKRSVSVFNAGGAAILVNGESIAAGLFLGWRVDRQNERLTDIVVDATGSSALVSWTE